MKEVISAKMMRQSDAALISSGTSSEELVSRAAKSVFDAFDFSSYRKIVIICGKGNNGADGLALALLLKSADLICDVTTSGCFVTGENSLYLEKCRNAEIVCTDFDDGVSFDGYDLIVDCLFGTGFHGEASGVGLDIIRAVNTAKKKGAKVLSVDIPSGISGDNGLGGEHIISDFTFSIGTLKSGLFLGCGKDAVGKIKNLDIGIPIIGKPSYLCGSEDFTDVIFERKNLCNKGDFGYITLLGGSIDYTGAVKLAENAAAAMRSGCGVCRAAIPRSAVSLTAPCLLEATITTIDDVRGSMLSDRDGIDRALTKAAAVGIGMGWGRGEHNGEILEYILENYKIPILIDADGLNALCSVGTDILKKNAGNTVLTPHLKEFERLSGVPVNETLTDPIGYAKKFAGEYNVTLLLKGPTTVITDGETVYLVDRGCAGMATAGSGDVLSGIITSLLGYSHASLPLTAACGAWIAGRAGEIAEHRKNPVSMIASDTISAISDAVGEIYSHHFN